MDFDRQNPYAPPQQASEPAAAPGALSREQVRRRLAVPAYGILASVLVNIAWIGWALTTVAWTFIAGAEFELIAAVWFAIFIAASVLLNYSATRSALAMLQLRDYRAAIRGAWFSCMPCNLGCIVAIPFALYADWLLRDPRVHAVFSPERIRFFGSREAPR